MNMPQFTAAAAFDMKASTAGGPRFAAMSRAAEVVPQSACGLTEWFSCALKIGSCIPMFVAGNVSGGLACVGQGAPECLKCLGLQTT